MAKLIYIANVSLDGYMEDADGSFDWSEPSEELHRFFGDLIRPVGTYLYGRRMYETMAVWETEPELFVDSDFMQDFADVWTAAEKIVYSTTLESVATSRTRIERAFDADAVRRLKDSADKDLAIGGAHIAAQAFKTGLVDECHLVVLPVLVGGGKPALPSDIRIDLELLDERRFDNGAVHLRYGLRT